MTAALKTMLALRLEDGRRWGEAATELQRADATAILDSTDGPRRHWLSRSKGYSKTGDVAAMSLSVLLTQLRPGAEAYACATDRDQAALLLRAVAGYVARTPGLSSEVRIESQRVLVPSRGTELVVLPADVAGANGLKPAWLVIDELCNWSEDQKHRLFYDTITANVPKVRGSRMVVISTCGAVGHFSERHFEIAGRDPAWRRSHVAGPSPWLDRADIESARRTLMPVTFQRWFQNEWTSGGDDRLASWEQLQRAARLDGPQLWTPGHRYYGGADLGLSHDRSVLAVVHSEVEPGGDVRSRRFVLDRMMVWSGRPGDKVDLDHVEQAILGLHRHYHGPQWRLDPWQGEHMASRLRKAGVPIETRQYSPVLFDEIATRLAELFRNDLIDLPNDPELLDELATVKVREVSPGRFRIDTRSRTLHDDRVMGMGYGITLAWDQLGSSARRPQTPEERERLRLLERRKRIDGASWRSRFDFYGEHGGHGGRYVR